jgi:hypothetical protein
MDCTTVESFAFFVSFTSDDFDEKCHAPQPAIPVRMVKKTVAPPNHHARLSIVSGDILLFSLLTAFLMLIAIGALMEFCVFCSPHGNDKVI